MNWKRILTAGVLTGALTIHSAAALTVTVDGTDTGMNTYVENGTTYVPLRAAAQHLGDVEVSWTDGAARVAAASVSQHSSRRGHRTQTRSAARVKIRRVSADTGAGT